MGLESIQLAIQFLLLNTEHTERITIRANVNKGYEPPFVQWGVTAAVETA